MPNTSTNVPRCLYAASDISDLCGIDTIPPTITYQRPNIVFGNCANTTSTDSKEKRLSNVDIFPNPSSGLFTVSNTIDTDKLQIEIINTLGQTVKTETTKNSNQTTIDMSMMSKGVYYLKVNTNEGAKLFKLILD